MENTGSQVLPIFTEGPLGQCLPLQDCFLERRMTQDSIVGRTSCRLPWGGPPMLTNWAAEV